jgi:pyrroline-5-carboxylate reductase
VLAVKPAALDEVAPELLEARAAVSVLAATATARVGAALPGVPILRVMPNQPVEVRRGVLCYARGPELPDELAERLLSLLGVLGALVEVPEEQLEAAMAVMSCSPAYVAVVAGSLADAGAAEGLDPKLSAELVAQTLAGTAELLRKRDPEAIRAAVAPPGGATEAGLDELSKRGVEAAFAAAVDASLERFR